MWRCGGRSAGVRPRGRPELLSIGRIQSGSAAAARAARLYSICRARGCEPALAARWRWQLL
eukprot:1061708-Prymnesium_polylepis.1